MSNWAHWVTDFLTTNDLNFKHCKKRSCGGRSMHIYPAQQEYCLRQLPDISGDICLDYIGTWRHKYFVSGIYNLKKVILTRKPLA